MNLLLCCARQAAFVCAAVLTVACSGNPPQQNPQRAELAPAGDFFVGSRPVYARLVNERGGSWVFTDVTASDAPLESGYLVRLNDLTPAFDTRAAECMPQVYPEAHRCSPTHPFRDKHAGVFDKIINGSIAVGTAGKVTDISQSYETRFEEPDFNRAVDEALVNSGLKQNRRELIKRIETYETRLEVARAELAEAARQVAAAQDGSGEVAVQVRPRLAGLTEYYEGDIDFRALLDIEHAAGTELPDTELEAAAILPCKAQQCLLRAEQAHASLEHQLRERKQRLSAAAAPGPATYRVSCAQTTAGSYLIVAECPEEIVGYDAAPVVVPMRVTILSRDFENLYPEFDLADRNLSVRIDGRSVVFENVTDEYLTLTAQTMYYNSQVNTASLAIDIPPGIAVSRDIAEFVSQPIEIESSYRQMTPDKAMGTAFQFGFAVRYRMASRAEELTLHDLRAFNVGCVIDNRLESGACEPESLAERSAPERGEFEREEFGPL